MTTEASICSQAAIMVGAEPFTTFEDGTTESILAAAIYEDQRNWLLGAHRWRFASRLLQLSRDTIAPVGRWGASYQIPADCLVVTAVLVNDRNIPFDRYEQKILCDAQATDSVILDYIRVPAVDSWPPYFVNALVCLLASVMAISLAEDASKAQLFEARFQRLFGQARNLDSQGRTAGKIGMGSFGRFVIGGGASDRDFERP